jgi:hypothetical protein
MDNNMNPGAPPPVDVPPTPGFNNPPVDVPPTPAPAPAPAPQFGAGGVTGKTGLAKFFDGITLTDIGTIAIITAVGLFAICYYRRRIQHLKEEKSETKKKLEEIEVNVVNALGPNYKKMNEWR